MILPSEKAFSYKMRLEALRRLPGRPKNNSVPVGQEFDGRTTREYIADNSPDSNTQIQRYIRLTELIPEIMNLVDEQRMAMRPAVELSYLAPEEQKVVYEETMLRDCMPSHAQTIRMRKLSERNMLTDSTIDDIMREEKPNQKEKLHIPYDQIREFLPRNTTYKQKCEYIRQALEFYKKHAS